MIKSLNKKMKLLILLIIILIGISQSVSYYVCDNIKNNSEVLLENAVNLTYVENYRWCFWNRGEQYYRFCNC